MVTNSKLALTALQEALVAARNIAGESRDVFDLVDTLASVPLLIADDKQDRTEDLVRTFEQLAQDYSECAVAAATARRLRA
jgi:hypothetical protein